MLQNQNIKAVIAFDQQLVADGLEAILTKNNGITIKGLIKNDENIHQFLSVIVPDVIIFEFACWSVKYPDLMLKLKNLYPDLKILIVSELISYENVKLIMPFVNGYLLKTCSAAKVTLAIKEIIDSGKYICPKALEEIFNFTNEVSRKDSELTDRENEVLCTWIESKGNFEIAAKLNISESTVRTHMNNIRQKLGDLNHLQLMTYACRQNILNPNVKPICPNCKSFCG